MMADNGTQFYYLHFQILEKHFIYYRLKISNTKELIVHEKVFQKKFLNLEIYM